ncbi:hypothetical protein FQV39_28600 [Bosea sp. F3-2]|uniref:hypothetical protein n=1 Tax=Bosea sp. F3-2 TaxID=2599640 RepID=UPI0011ECB307|nr:hypothetical protein [Bosea sp. F3-2]QEL26126.1 hypothetical protein FQV39_28600 [Bosea sp. F3-2]
MNAHAGRPSIAAEDIIATEEIAEARQATEALLAFLKGEATITYRSEILAGLRELAEPFGYKVSSEEDEKDPPPALDASEIDESLARAMRGEVEDCAIHLGRALPAQYAPIADKLHDALRTAR